MAHGPALLEIHDLKKELAASQARCRELEDHVGHYKSVSTGQYLKLTEAKTEIAQLQATLAAREAQLKEFQSANKALAVRGEHLTSERDAAVQEAGRLREAALWAMNKVKRLSTRAVDYKRAEEFIEYERELRGA